MNDNATVPAMPVSLDRQAWHRPKVSIIVTHFDYARHLEDALRSVIDQAHTAWECVVVDDGSSPDQRLLAEAIVREIGDQRVRLLALDVNQGQIPAFFAGLDATTGEFVCPLDPDDRYAVDFLEKAVAAHLNRSVMCPLVCTDQYLLKDGEVIAAVNAGHRLASAPVHGKARRIDDGPASVLYFPAHARGWHWTSTSSLMLRRPAAELLRPKLWTGTRKCLDSYLAQGCHILGGTLFVAEPLVYRQLHEENSWISDKLYASSRPQHRPDAVNLSALMRDHAILALKDNGIEFLEPKQKGVLAKWRRSAKKRWARLKAKLPRRRKTFGSIQIAPNGALQIIGRQPNPQVLAQIQHRIGPDEAAIEISAEIADEWVRHR